MPKRSGDSSGTGSVKKAREPDLDYDPLPASVTFVETVERWIEPVNFTKSSPFTFWLENKEPYVLWDLNKCMVHAEVDIEKPGGDNPGKDDVWSLINNAGPSIFGDVEVQFNQGEPVSQTTDEPAFCAYLQQLLTQPMELANTAGHLKGYYVQQADEFDETEMKRAIAYEQKGDKSVTMPVPANSLSRQNAAFYIKADGTLGEYHSREFMFTLDSVTPFCCSQHLPWGYAMKLTFKQSPDKFMILSKDESDLRVRMKRLRMQMVGNRLAPDEFQKYFTDSALRKELTMPVTKRTIYQRLLDKGVRTFRLGNFLQGNLLPPMFLLGFRHQDKSTTTTTANAYHFPNLALDWLYVEKNSKQIPKERYEFNWEEGKYGPAYYDLQTLVNARNWGTFQLPYDAYSKCFILGFNTTNDNQPCKAVQRANETGEISINFQLKTPLQARSDWAIWMLAIYDGEVTFRPDGKVVASWMTEKTGP